MFVSRLFIGNGSIPLHAPRNVAQDQAMHAPDSAENTRVKDLPSGLHLPDEATHVKAMRRCVAVASVFAPLLAGPGGSQG